MNRNFWSRNARNFTINTKKKTKKHFVSLSFSFKFQAHALSSLYYFFLLWWISNPATANTAITAIHVNGF